MYFLIVFFAAPTAALAVRSQFKGSYSEDYNARKAMRTCDNDPGGNHTYSEFEMRANNGTGSATQGRVTDRDGANNICASAAWNQPFPNGKPFYVVVVRHRTCEDIPFAPDKCGNWQAT